MKQPGSRVQRTIAGILSVIGVLLGLAAWAIWTNDGYTKPKSPDRTIGRVYPLNSHGAIVYLTRQERFVINGLQALAAVTFGTGVILDVLSRGSRR